MKDLKVICFYWQGDRWREEGMTYDKVDDPSFSKHLQRVGRVTRGLVERYINNLFYGVTKWADKRPFEFICFTNDPIKVNPKITIRGFDMVTKRGVLPRMYMFSEKAGLFGSQVFCIDLDVVVVGSLKNILEYDDLFCVRTAFAPGEGHLIDGDIMSFTAGVPTEDIFWKPLIANVRDAEIKSMGGRERMWIRHVASDIAQTWDQIAPEQVVSYKRHVRGRDLPKNAKIVSCHGYPRPHQINELWRTENWK